MVGILYIISQVLKTVDENAGSRLTRFLLNVVHRAGKDTRNRYILATTTLIGGMNGKSS
jgi:hypothetical protein